MPLDADCTADLFPPSDLELAMGRLLYVASGAWPPTVMVHGIPDWSLTSRHLIAGLTGSYRHASPHGSVKPSGCP